MRKNITKIFLPILIVATALSARAEESIFSDERSSGFANRWVEPKNTSAHEVGKIPYSMRPSFLLDRHVIHWRWDKTVFSYSRYSWGMQWRGCNEPIDFLAILFLDKPPEQMTKEYYKNFNRRAEQVFLKFGIVFTDISPAGGAVSVRFDMVGDVPSEEVNILSHMIPADYPPNPLQIYPKLWSLGIDKNRPYSVQINLADFAFLDQGMDLTKIKQIVFGIPKDGPQKGDVLLYNIRIE